MSFCHSRYHKSFVMFYKLRVFACITFCTGSVTHVYDLSIGDRHSLRQTAFAVRRIDFSIHYKVCCHLCLFIHLLCLLTIYVFGTYSVFPNYRASVLQNYCASILRNYCASILRMSLISLRFDINLPSAPARR